jgi:acetyl-CoA C-acetyltransferase
MDKKDIVIVSAVRIPYSKFDSPLNDFMSNQLGAMVLKEVIARVGVKPEDVDEVFYGASVEGEIARELDVPDRQALLKAGFPTSTISCTINRACCASITAARQAMRMMKLGEANICIVAGADNMPRAAHLAEDLRKGVRLGHVTLKDYIFGIGYTGFEPVAKECGEVAVEYGIGREMQDAWGMRSQENYFKALAEGKYKVGEEIMPVKIPQKKGDPIIIEKDESPRKTSMELLAKLPPVYASPTVTAGNAPPRHAGAGAMLLMTREEAEKRGLKPLATVLGVFPAADEPRLMATVPAKAINRGLKELGMIVDQLNLIEINEAFAAVVLVSTKILSNGDDKKWEAIKERTNVNGGAIAIGHPIGASGGRITMHLMYELMRRGGGYGTAAICGGLSQGEAIFIKV